MGLKKLFYYSAFAGVACLVTAFAASGETPQAKPGAIQGQLAEKYDTKLPVEISADNLEVLQNQNKAIFKGNVIAVQGKIRLNSDAMIVHYKQKSDQPGQQQPPRIKTPSSQDSGSMGAITLIEVEGNVLVATPEESAKGDKGNYQVDEKMLHLSGGNVILTRGKNILRGTELVYNLETGHSVLTNKGSRVRGVFVPGDEQKGGARVKTKIK